VNGEDIRHLSGLDSPVKDADEISILRLLAVDKFIIYFSEGSWILRI